MVHLFLRRMVGYDLPPAAIIIQEAKPHFIAMQSIVANGSHNIIS